MALAQNIWNFFLKIINLPNEENDSEKPLSAMLQDLLDAMDKAKNITTRSMAQVGQARNQLKKLIDEQDKLKAEAKAFLNKGNEAFAENRLKQAIALDPKIEAKTEEVNTLDARAKANILRFRELEEKKDKYKAAIEEANQLEQFNKISEQVSSATGLLDNSLTKKIDARIEEIELKSTQVAAELLLDSDNIEDLAIDREIKKITNQEKLEAAMLELKSQPKIEGDKKPQLTKSPSDAAKELLDRSAFNGTLDIK